MEPEKGSESPAEPVGVEITPVAQPVNALTGTIVPVEQVVALQQVQIWQGQFPPPDAVASYELTMPGAFNRLMSMAEKQQDASIEASREARGFLRDDTKRGHYLGALVVALAIVGAIVCVWLAQPWVAVALVGVPVLAVAKALVDSTKAERPTAAVAVTTTAPAAQTKAAEEDTAKEQPKDQS